MLKPTFRDALLLGPLAYAIHHSEEHLLFNFREWRLSYFADNNPLSTEAVFIVLTGIGLVYILAYSLFPTRVAAQMAIVFAMMSQVANVLFHLVGTIVFWDFSPGLITGILVYVPVNVIIMRAALREGLVTTTRLWLLFAVGAALFIAFELVGPFPMLAFIVTSWAWIAASIRRESEVAPPLTSVG